MLHLTINLALIAVGFISVFMGFAQYGFWTGNIPGGGFMPVLAGVLMILFCGLNVIDKKARAAVTKKFNMKALLPVAAVVLVILASALLGVMISITLMVFFWLLLVEKEKWHKALLVALLVGAGTYGIFKVWLSVPFAKGLLGLL